MEKRPTFNLARLARGAMIPLCIAAMVGCGHLDMYDQVKYDPYEQSAVIFAKENGGDGAASRPIEPNTVARTGSLPSDPLRSGVDADGQELTASPIEIDEVRLAEGERKYVVYCVPCHGALGNGKGIAASYFATAGGVVPSFYDERLITASDGYYFNVITNGKNLMYSYASRVYPEDRWAIIAYIRTLQAAPPPGAIVPTPAPTEQGTPAAPAAATPAPTAAP
ncbi:MAG: cytochrome c [Roseiflexaceae bacterium]|nr:cytochrome c [Roseiflexaceae bacterium]